MTKKISNPEILAVRAAAEADPARGRVWVGLDVGMKSTAVCVLDGDGKVVHQCAGTSVPARKRCASPPGVAVATVACGSGVAVKRATSGPAGRW